MSGLGGFSASGEAGVSFIEAIDVEGDNLDENVDVFLSNLEWVELYGVDFRSMTMKVDEDDPEGPLCRILESLRRRQASEAPLKRLKITECTIKEEWVETIKGVMGVKGGVVEWDGKTGDFAEECESEMDEEVQVWS